jgi:hypothetical protein
VFMTREAHKHNCKAHVPCPDDRLRNNFAGGGGLDERELTSRRKLNLWCWVRLLEAPRPTFPIVDICCASCCVGDICFLELQLAWRLASTYWTLSFHRAHCIQGRFCAFFKYFLPISHHVRHSRQPAARGRHHRPSPSRRLLRGSGGSDFGSCSARHPQRRE